MSGGAPFRIEETVEPSGAVRLSLFGELDLATKQILQQRLWELKSRGARVRIDLSQLEFIDASGLTVLLNALDDSQKNPWSLEVDTCRPRHIARLLSVLGLELS